MSTALATRNGAAEIVAVEDLEPMALPRAGFSFADIKQMAQTVVDSRLFPSVKTPEAACGLMLLCQSEGIHPMKALQRFHLIDGRPSKQANAMLGDFLASGGRVEWGERNHESVTATFSHPAGGTLTVTWDMAQAKLAGLAGKDNWKKYPRQMLTARVISEGVRAVFPDAVAGLYTPEEVMDFDDKPAPPVARNDSGYGRGSYASPQQVDAYNLAMRNWIDRQNAEWADSWTGANGDQPDGVPELINPWQLNNHLLKWAVETGHLDPGIVPEEAKARQPPMYLAIVYHRSKDDRRALAKEADRYVIEQAQRKTAKFYKDHPELDPDAQGDSTGDAADFPVDEMPEESYDEPGADG